MTRPIIVSGVEACSGRQLTGTRDTCRPGASVAHSEFVPAFKASGSLTFPRVQFLQEPTRGLSNRFVLSPIAVFHGRNRSHGVSACVTAGGMDQHPMRTRV